MNTMPSYSSMHFWSWARDTAVAGVLALAIVGIGTRPASAQSPEVIPVPIANPVTTYAAWGNPGDRDQGMVFIYPLANGTDLNLYQTTSTTEPIQINTPVLSVSGAAKDVPIAFGPLTADNHFFKLQASKPVNWELVTPDYSAFKEASRFVASERQTFLGTKFVFHADDDIPGFAGSPGTEEIVIINPGTTASTVNIEKLNSDASPPAYALVATTVVAAGNFDEFSVNITGLGKAAGKSLGTGRGHYRITVVNGPPVLVWEGRMLTNNTAIGAASDGSTIGSTIYASVPNDELNPSASDGAAIGTGVVLRIVGITAASYTVWSSPGPGIAFTSVRTGTVAAGGVKSELDLTEDRLYKITTNAGEKIQVQYRGARDPLGSGLQGGEMIGGNDGGVTTNPGTSFKFYFDGEMQSAINVMAPQPGTVVNVTGPVSGAGLSTSLPDQVLHFLPGVPSDGEPVSAEGLYTVTANKPVWVVIAGHWGDQQGYFVYTGGPVELSSSLGPINLRFCHSAGFDSGDPDCVQNGLATTGKVASQPAPQTACAPGQPATGTANVSVTPGDYVTVSWNDLNCGSKDGSESVRVNSIITDTVGTDVQLHADAPGNARVRLRVVPRDAEDDDMCEPEERPNRAKRIVVETLGDGRRLESRTINGDERISIRLANSVPDDVITSATVKFWVGRRFTGAKTIIARAFLNGEPVGQPVRRELLAVPRTTFSELQVYTPENFGTNDFDRIDFRAAPGSWFGLGSADLQTTRP